MAQIEVLLPKMGESVAEATIINWLKEEGDTVELEESIVEIATDKVDSEVPAPEEGVLVKKLFDKDDVVKVGEVIAIISTDGEAPESGNDSGSEAPATEEKASQETVEAYAEEAMAPVNNGASNGVEISKTGADGQFFSPLVRSIAEKENVSMQELESIDGSGQGGRVTKKDILAYIKEGKPAQSAPATNGQSTTAPAQEKPAPQTASKPSGQALGGDVKAPIVTPNPGDEIKEMDRMRKMIAEHMVMSKRVSPHVTSYVEADVTNIVNWRNKIKKPFLEREGEKMTFTPIFIEAIVKAIKDFPHINVSLNGQQIIQRKDINIGMAAALPSGNLIVPVIKKADQLNLTGLTKQVNDLANRARENKLTPEEIQGGTYTITNVGTFGNVMGTPIINQPQVAIMAVGAIRKIPAVIETPEGDFIGIRHKMFLSHSYDHRIVDGALGGMFVRKVADYLEAFDPDREI